MRASEARVQWAIRMPNGDLYGRARQTATTGYTFVEFFAIPSPLRDMLGMVEPEPPQPVLPVIFDDRAQADALHAELAAEAAKVGVLHWGGVVVQRLCTPFTSGDPTAEFVDDVVAWAEAQGES